jgi:hypothetical protein
MDKVEQLEEPQGRAGEEAQEETGKAVEMEMM